MRELTTKPNEYNSASKIIKQAVDDEFDKICWRTLKTYPYVQGMHVCTIYDYVDNTGLYLYDFGKMIKIYEKSNKPLAKKVVKDKTALGPVSRMFVYKIDDLDMIWKYFNTDRQPIMFEYIGLKDFIDAIRGDEEFVKVRGRWYKRLGLTGVKREPGARKRINKLEEVYVSRIADKVNTNKKTKSYFYKLADMLTVLEIYKEADRKKQLKIQDLPEDTKQPA